MTYTHRSETINGYTVSIRQEKAEKSYTVYITTPHGTIDRKSNPQPDMTRAMRTYRRYMQYMLSMALA